MKTKEYVFTEKEIIVLRDALIGYRQSLRWVIKTHPTPSDRLIANHATAQALAAQFKNDLLVMK